MHEGAGRGGASDGAVVSSVCDCIVTCTIRNGTVERDLTYQDREGGMCGVMLWILHESGRARRPQGEFSLSCCWCVAVSQCERGRRAGGMGCGAGWGAGWISVVCQCAHYNVQEAGRDVHNRLFIILLLISGHVTM